MDISSSSFESPRPLVRPRGARLLQGFSPKLARAMQFTRRSVFEHWIRLEADPRVTSFCERPASAVVNGQPIAIDFWVQSDDDEELVLLMPGDRDPDLPEQVLGLPLAQIPLAERTALSTCR